VTDSSIFWITKIRKEYDCAFEIDRPNQSKEVFRLLKECYSGDGEFSL
jgi:hypothetical protein